MTKMQKAAKKAWVTIRRKKQARHDAAVKAWKTRKMKSVLIQMAKAGLPRPKECTKETVYINRPWPKKFSRERIRSLYSIYSDAEKVADIVGCSKETVYLAIYK